MEFRPAEAGDLGVIIEMLADDELGATRERPGAEGMRAYRTAFEEIGADPNNELIVAISEGGPGDSAVAGVFQLTFIPNLTYQGGKRAQIEGVRVAGNRRGQGVGREMFLWAIQRARERGCRMVQLTSNKQRPDAIRFYESLGFEATHEGMKLMLEG